MLFQLQKIFGVKKMSIISKVPQEPFEVTADSEFSKRHGWDFKQYKDFIDTYNLYQRTGEVDGRIWHSVSFDCPDDLSGTYFRGADLTDVLLFGKDFRYANLRGIKPPRDFHNNDIRGADIRGADFDRVSIASTKLTVSQLEQTDKWNLAELWLCDLYENDGITLITDETHGKDAKLRIIRDSLAFRGIEIDSTLERHIGKGKESLLALMYSSLVVVGLYTVAEVSGCSIKKINDNNILSPENNIVNVNTVSGGNDGVIDFNADESLAICFYAAMAGYPVEGVKAICDDAGFELPEDYRLKNDNEPN